MAHPSAPRVDARSHVVVVLSWNGRADTLACVASLLEDPDAPRILVVDNGSYDGVLEQVASRWPQVERLQTGRNRGFAGGMNEGLAWAHRAGAQVVTVLNNDTIVPVGAMGVLRGLAARGGAAVSPEIRYRDAPERLWFGGGSLAPPDWFPHHTPPERLARPRGGVRDVDVLSGCCVTAAMTVWDEVGGFDERYFLNFEDSEWSVRAARAGVALQVSTEATIAHAVSASFTGAAATLGTYYYTRNGWTFIGTAGGGRAARRRFVVRVLRESAARTRRTRAWRDGARELRVIGRGVRDARRGRLGPAPVDLVNRVERWRRPSGAASAPVAS